MILGIVIGVFILVCIFVSLDAPKAEVRAVAVFLSPLSLLILMYVLFQTEERELSPIDISVYHAVVEQTDSTPYITADGSVIDPQNLQRWAAISRDQLAGYPFGSTFVLRCKCPYDGTTWEVHDVMNARYTTSIDLLVPESETGKWEGVIHKP